MASVRLICPELDEEDAVFFGMMEHASVLLLLLMYV
jgi:hypothetical protein